MLEVDRLKRRIADRASRALAGVRDASTASLATSIPRAVGLLDVLDVGLPSGRWVTERWLAPSAYGLPFVIGAGAHGALGLDLVHDGPHALIGGTSGAGKSELLQSMVASLASRHPPDRLNFLFVDYKGGASSSVFERLPHTVGYVTNLDSALAVRALTSLRAELHHRMALLEGRAKDLAEMRIMAPAEAPPSLVIVVDEFATLVKEVPEFVAGIVDVAQRGRSLGIHLVLATQRPSGAVNENILANTNLRISLRMLDRAESSAVIGSPEAAAIPVPLRGRGLVRVGPTQLIPFQSAYGGALLTGVATRPPVLVGDFVAPHDQPVPITGGGVDAIGSTTQLVALIDAIVAAADMLRLPAPRRPWRDALADVVTLDSVLSDPACLVCCDEPGRTILVGMLDVPARQEQRPLLIDLEQGGGCLVFGSGGSGKTTLLRTVVAAAAATASPESIAVLGFDFASRGLASVGRLPHVVDVAGGDDLEAVTRHITVLEHEVARRRRMLADVNAEHLTAYHRHNRRLPRILLLVDGFGGATDVLGDSGGALSVGESWLDRLMRVIIDGRQVGVHAVITADRRNGVPSKLHAAISERIVLRQADEDGYSEHGVRLPAAAAPTLSPGRGRWQGDQEVQVAVVAVQHTAFDQQQALCALAARLGAATPDVLRSSALPDVVGSPTPAERGALRVALGVADVTGEWVDLDLTWSHAAVVGGPRSGRSTALASIAAGLRATADVYVVGPSSSPLAGSCRRSAFGRADRVLPLLDRLANLLELGRPTRAVALLVDDLDTFDDPLLSGAWERLAASDELRIVATLESRSLAGFSANPVIAGLRRARRLLVLRPDDPGEFLQLTGIKLPQRPGQRLVPGRGVYVADRVPHVVQVATPPDEPG
jgi:S-DNA-T family DNA segregation ATPase FtsK/SpoIIIE